MLTLETPLYEFDGIVVFRDHAQPTTFHYLAGSPRLTVRDGKPHLALLKYREALDASPTAPAVRDQLGGGFMTFSVDCGVDAETLQSIRDELAKTLPDDARDQLSLVPVLYTKGKVEVIALDRQQGLADDPDSDDADTPATRFVRGVLGSATPSLFQDQRAVFSIALSPDGIALLEQAYRAELSPIGVLYELEFSGLRPALSVRVRADAERIYEQFKTGLNIGIDVGATETSGTPAPSSGSDSNQPARSGVALDFEIEKTIESLVESGAIEIEVVQQQVGDDIDKLEAEAMKLVKEDILKEFFSPTLSAMPSQPLANDQMRELASSISDISRGQSRNPTTRQKNGVELGFQLRYRHSEEQKVITYDYDVAAPETRTHAPNGFFSALVGDTNIEDHIREVDLADPFFQTLEVEVQTTPEFERLAIASIVVDLQYGGTEDAPQQTASLLFSPDDPEPKFFRSFRNQDDFSYRYQVSYRFAPSDDVAAASQALTTPWQTTTSRALVVHPPEDIGLISVLVEPAVIPWDLVPKVEVKLSYEDPASAFRTERSFVLDPTSDAQPWIVRVPEGAPTDYTAQYTWHLSNGSKIEGEPQTQGHPRLFVPSPFGGQQLRLRVVPAVDPSSVGLVLAEIAHTDPGTGLEIRRTLSMSPPYRAQWVKIPLIDPQHTEVTWSYRLHPTGGGTPAEKGPFVTGSRALVITEGDVMLHDLELVVSGDLLAVEVLALQVDLRAEPPEGRQPEIVSHLFEAGGETSTRVRLNLRADRDPVFEYQTTALMMNGDAIVRAWAPHGGPALGLAVATVVTPNED
ncbi:MAG: hypothetical protein AAF799_08230 [Myxococcota bacterium]